jgi:hypothetical protein
MANLNGLMADALSNNTQFFLDRMNPIVDKLAFLEQLLSQLVNGEIALDQVIINPQNGQIRVLDKEKPKGVPMAPMPPDTNGRRKKEDVPANV